MNLFNTLLAIMASQFINTPYKWGGNNYDGLDCSGLVIRSLRDVGIKIEDRSSQSIYYWAQERKGSYSCEPGEDCLLFFGHSVDYIKHVAIGLNEEFMIEAGGSGPESRNMAKEDLARIDARVRIKPITNRSDLVASIKITY